MSNLNTAPYAVKAGFQAGFNNQGSESIALGFGAGATGQSTFAVAVGPQAGFINQGVGAVALGLRAGFTGQGAYSLAIGPYAGSNNLPQNAIAINASTGELNPGVSGLFIWGLNSSSGVNAPLIYDTATSGVMYRTIGSTATRLNVYPMDLVTPIMTAATTAGVGGNYTASASSEYFDGNYPAWKAFNGATGGINEWATNATTTNYWLQMRLPVARNVAYISMQGRYSGTEIPSTFYLRVSNDGTNFIDVQPSPGSSYAFTGQYSAIFCGYVVPSEYRNYTYYRLQFPTSYAGPNPGLSEVKMLRPSAFSSTSTNLMACNLNDFFRCSTTGWAFNFVSRGGYVVVKASVDYSVYTGAVGTYKLWMYIDGTRANFTAANEVTNWAYLYTDQWTLAPTFYWAGQLAAGDHVITFDTQAGVYWDNFQNGSFEVYEIL